MAPAFIITIDTEGDNLWARPERLTTENARFLPRFQRLSDTYGFRPTYLVNYEMAVDAVFREFGRGVLRARTAEIGLHIHPWCSPPPEIAYDARSSHIYLYELSDDALHAKIGWMTRLLSDTFEIRPVSHRAGRWGFDERVARVLVEHGYLVDCSVTPGISWKRYQGDPQGHGGPDYTEFPAIPYFLDLSDIKRPGPSQLLEAPVTMVPRGTVVERLYPAFGRGPARKVLQLLFGPRIVWLRPNGRNLKDLLRIVDWAIRKHAPMIEFMLHSSELMPGGSPTFATPEEIETLYAHLSELFGQIASAGFVGMTLAEYRAAFSSESVKVG